MCITNGIINLSQIQITQLDMHMPTLIRLLMSWLVCSFPRSPRSWSAIQVIWVSVHMFLSISILLCNLTIQICFDINIRSAQRIQLKIIGVLATVFMHMQTSLPNHMSRICHHPNFNIIQTHLIYLNTPDSPLPLPIQLNWA